MATTIAALGFYDGTLAGDGSPASLQLTAAAVYPLADMDLRAAYLSGHSPVRRYLERLGPVVLHSGIVN